MIIELTKNELHDLYSCVQIRIKNLNEYGSDYKEKIKDLEILEDKLLDAFSS